MWFNQPWVADRLTPGTEVRLRGSLSRRGGFAVKTYDVGDARATADFAPVYPATEDVTPQRLRAARRGRAPDVDAVADALPAALRERGRAARCAATRSRRSTGPATSTRPRSGAAASPSTSCSCSSSGSRAGAREREAAIAPPLGEPGELIGRYRAALPFALTPEQESADRELDADLAGTVPMQRLLQGDVGSGKTVVALYALLRAVERGRQGALMAPTETLAEQHFLTIEGICADARRPRRRCSRARCGRRSTRPRAPRSRAEMRSSPSARTRSSRSRSSSPTSPSRSSTSSTGSASSSAQRSWRAARRTCST